MTDAAPETPASAIASVQRRTLRLLFVSQIAGGVGMSTGMSVGALLAADMVSVGASGLAQSAAVLGAALLAVPATRIVRRHGRGPSLAAAYLAAAVGGILIVSAAMTGSVALLFFGFFCFGGGTTAGLQARYAAVDLAPPTLYGRHLSFVVWATTLGAVAGPNLAGITGAVLGRYRVPTLAAPFVLSTALFALAAAILLVWLRPDPLRLAQSAGAVRAASGTATGMRHAFRSVMAHPDARLGIIATAVGQAVMVGVMAMTPVHIRGAGHAPAVTLRLVGIVLSVHVAGMYAFAPVMGWLSDRVGRPRVILGGTVLLVAACAMAGTAGQDPTRLAIGLWLLGLGWSATMVAGSALLSVSMPGELRPSVQGVSDLLTGLAGASAGALSGLVVQTFGYPALTLVAALTAMVLTALAVLAIAGRARLVARVQSS